MEWELIEGFENYAVNRDGVIKNLKTGRIKSTYISDQGYIKVGLNKNNKTYVRFLHRIIAKAFIPNPESKEEVNHINGIKSDYRISNLEWVTRSENVIHSFRTGLQKPLAGVNNPLSKLSEDDVRSIRSLYAAGGVSMKNLGTLFKIDAAVIERVVNRKSWTHVK